LEADLAYRWVIIARRFTPRSLSWEVQAIEEKKNRQIINLTIEEGLRSDLGPQRLPLGFADPGNADLCPTPTPVHFLNGAFGNFLQQRQYIGLIVRGRPLLLSKRQ
jgi:hypothetical protein